MEFTLSSILASLDSRFPKIDQVKVYDPSSRANIEAVKMDRVVPFIRLCFPSLASSEVAQAT